MTFNITILNINVMFLNINVMILSIHLRILIVHKNMDRYYQTWIRWASNDFVFHQPFLN